MSKNKKTKKSGKKSGLESLVFILVIAAVAAWKLGYLTPEDKLDIPTEQASSISPENKIEDEKNDEIKQKAQPTLTESTSASSKAMEKTDVTPITSDENVNKESEESGSEQSVDHFKEANLKQDEIKKNFLDSTQAEFKLPTNMDYSVVDTEDDIGVIYGKDKDGSKEFAMLATTRKSTVAQSIEYLKESEKMLPMLAGVELDQKSKPEVIEAPEGSGLKKVTLVKLGVKDGKAIYAAITQRADEVGSYMFILKAPGKFYEENEGYLDNLLSSFKTKQPDDPSKP